MPLQTSSWKMEFSRDIITLNHICVHHTLQFVFLYHQMKFFFFSFTAWKSLMILKTSPPHLSYKNLL